MKKNILLYFKDWNFKTKILVIISALIVFIVMLISTLNFVWYSKNSTKQTINQTQQIIDQISINVDTYLDELYRLNLSPYFNDSIMEELEKEYNSGVSNLNKKRKIESFLASVMTLPRSEILRVYILTDYNLYSYIRTPFDMENYYNYKDTNWYQETKKSSSPILIPIHYEKVFGDKETKILSIAQRIRSKKDNSKVLAVIKVDANYDGIKSICDKVQMNQKGSLFIVDENQNSVYQNNKLENKDIIKQLNLKSYKKDGYFIKTLNSEKYIINIASLKSTSLKVIAINSYKELTKNALTIRNMSILLALICALLSVALLFIIIENSFKPLFKIIHLMKEVQKGDLSVQMEVTNNDEIGYLARSFNKMIIQIKETLDKNMQLVKEVYQSRFLQKEAQYNILCSQIKPHFLYNTLNTVSLLIKCNDNKGAVSSIENLSNFLRGIMNSDKIIRLSDEIGIINSYLSIQKARYGDDLSYTIDISPDFLNYKIPTLTLQPIVENAIIHGCEVKRGKSEIHIFNTTDEKYLYINIVDNGAGIETQLLTELNLKLSEEPDKEELTQEQTTLTESIGLINVNKRIKLKFGQIYGLHIYSEEMKGTKVILKLPLIQ